MTQAYASDVTVTTTAVDLVTIVAGMASVTSYVQNRGPEVVAVAFTSVNSAPAGGYVMLPVGQSITGSAAHIWTKALNNSATISIGVS